MPTRRWSPRLSLVAIVLGVVVVSALHDFFSMRSVLFHEIFKRLYYVPIVCAGIQYGVPGGAGIALLASAVYLPHIVLDGHMAAMLKVDQYGEVIVFLLVGGTTGLLSSRLRAERNRYRRAAEALGRATEELEARSDERLRLARLVTAGRMAGGVAHAIRNPLGALTGCLEILDAHMPASHPDREFLAMATRDLARLERVTTAFLQFASPAPPTSATVSVLDVVHGVRTVVESAGGPGRLVIEARPSCASPVARIDPVQLQQALVNLVLDGAADQGAPEVHIGVRAVGHLVLVTLDLGDVGSNECDIADRLEPFPESGIGDGLSLAIARRLIENQHGRVSAAIVDGRLRYEITLPEAGPDGDRFASTDTAAGHTTTGTC